MTNGSAPGRLRRWHPLPGSMLLLPVLLMIVVTFCTYCWYRDRTVALRQQTTSGTIVAHEPANHNRYGYTFKVNEKTYSGWKGPSDSEKFAVGQIVTVHYDPLDPNNNALVDFNELATDDLGPLPLLVGGLLVVAGFEVFRRRSVRKSTRLSPG